VVEKESGLPFFRDVSRRWSRHLMSRYFKERDDYRAADGKSRIWEGTNVSHTHRMMGKNRGLADRAAVQRAALNKRWRWHWAREDKTCSACGDRSIGIKHPLRHCKNEVVIEERDRWRKRVETCLRGIPAKHRPPLEELWSLMQRERQGEYACCGVFIPGFIENLKRGGDLLSKRGVGYLKKLTKVIGLGAREVLRVHTEQNIVTRGVELRQLSIKSFLVLSKTKEAEGAKAKEKRTARRVLNEDSEGDSDSEFGRKGNDGSDMEEKERLLKYPIKADLVLRKFLVKKTLLGGGVGRVRYWEFKAG
jgi:hypothetical protein